MTRDPDFGPILAVGRGGVDVESHAVGAVRLAPVDLETARASSSPRPVDAGGRRLAHTLVALGRLAPEHPSVVEADVNPLILHGDEATAVDALVVVDNSAQV